MIPLTDLEPRRSKNWTFSEELGEPLRVGIFIQLAQSASPVCDTLIPDLQTETDPRVTALLAESFKWEQNLNACCPSRCTAFLPVRLY